MSDKYHNRNVPWYMPVNTPAIDLSPNAGWTQPDELTAKQKAAKAAHANRQNARRAHVNKFFPESTRFAIWLEIEDRSETRGRCTSCDFGRRKDCKNCEGRGYVITENRLFHMERLTGTVRYMSRATWDGCCVMVTWDKGQTKYRTNLGLAKFADGAFRLVSLPILC